MEIPPLQEFLKAGVQFGHEKKRWNPKMQKFIFGDKKGIHIIDLTQTVPMLEEALKFLVDASREGSILFVGTKRQAAFILRNEAIRAGAYFVSHRWAGGLLTNFGMVEQSLNKLRKYEEQFEEGVEGRTKYEIAKMKVEWARLNRLYGGIKDMKRPPRAVVVVDPRYEVGAVVEANKLNIPVIAITDTNCDPDPIDYVVPGNDDAIGSISLFLKLFADATKFGNGGQGVKHTIKDYTDFEVKIIKAKRKVPGGESATIDTKEVSVDKKKTRAKIRIKSQAQEKPKQESSKPEKKPAKKPEKKQEGSKNEVSSRVISALEAEGLSLAKAKKMSDDELKAVKGLGEKAVEEIKKA
ncbi:30S ribosomal protein S2 [Candidatus Dojkabacteria bacterium]|uniref:Small ribosomal subunit protein uS2 n=1 Tax=Candidatus Dojkabacteria bacterium TaxID=2099670 RepID=A0A955L990_9BACT|nr:30S ribosomal protein S2 [Candidatus Dojkabacteria bacterium]